MVESVDSAADRVFHLIREVGGFPHHNGPDEKLLLRKAAVNCCDPTPAVSAIVFIVVVLTGPLTKHANAASRIRSVISSTGRIVPCATTFATC
jgi:hypothetical protein